MRTDAFFARSYRLRHCGRQDFGLVAVPAHREVRGIVSAIKVSKKGNRHGGKRFSRGALYHLLSNPVYVGEVKHKLDRHTGQHDAVIDRKLWEGVQEQLRTRAARRGNGRRTEAVKSPLAGKLFDESGEPMYVQGAAKGPHRYRYYVSKRLVKGETQGAERGWRLSASEIERLVSAAAQSMLGDHAAIALALEESGVESGQLVPALKSAPTWLERLRPGAETASALAELTERIDVSPEGIRISLRSSISSVEGDNTAQAIHITQEVLPDADEAARSRDALGA